METPKLVSLTEQVSVFDASNVEQSRNTFEYDNYSNQSNHAPLTHRTSVSGLDATFTTSYVSRGNPTASTRYLLSNGTINGSITSFLQYDIAGNVVKTVDANGHEKTFNFSDHFGTADSNIHSNSSPVELASVGQTSYAFASSVTNSLAQTSYKKFDYYTSIPVDTQDISGIISSAYSENEPLDRLTKTIRAVNTTGQNQTTVIYDDTARTITTSSDLHTNADGALVTKQFLDAFGRIIETRQYEGGSNYIVVQQQYDALGRLCRTSNPYRPWQGESAIWSQSAFDTLGRVLSVTTPDQAVTTTAYHGNWVLATDPIGRKRLSLTNVLGKVSDVWEITTPDSATEAISFPGHADVTAGYRTSYAYDVFDNLTGVTQGTQPSRTFLYDSLSRPQNGYQS